MAIDTAEFDLKPIGRSVPDASQRKVSARMKMVRCNNFRTIPEGWRCPSCNRNRVQVLDDMNVKETTKTISALIVRHHDHILDSIGPLLSMKPEFMFKRHVFSSWESSFICTMCNGRDASHLKRLSIKNDDADLARLTSFSPSDIGRSIRIERKSGMTGVEAFAQERFLEMRPDLLRATSMLEGIAALLRQNSDQEEVTSFIKQIIKTGLGSLSDTPARNVMFDGRILSSFARSEFRSAKNPIEDRILSNLQTGMTLPDFMNACAADHIHIVPYMTGNGVLYNFGWIVDYEKEQPLTDIVSPTHLYVLGLDYDRAGQWDEVSDMWAWREELMNAHHT